MKKAGLGKKDKKTEDIKKDKKTDDVEICQVVVPFFKLFAGLFLSFICEVPLMDSKVIYISLTYRVNAHIQLLHKFREP